MRENWCGTHLSRLGSALEECDEGENDVAHSGVRLFMGYSLCDTGTGDNQQYWDAVALEQNAFPIQTW